MKKSELILIITGLLLITTLSVFANSLANLQASLQQMYREAAELQWL